MKILIFYKQNDFLNKSLTQLKYVSARMEII
jgi:hypothetical protein